MPAIAAPIHEHRAPAPEGRDAASDESRQSWSAAYLKVRAETERHAAHLSAEDQTIQSMPDASPTKWHRAHTTWFFEQFLLVPHAPAYCIFDERFPYLFNSYYVAAGPRHAQPQRGMITRPSVDDVSAYRRHVDRAVERLIATAGAKAFENCRSVLELGLHHEQQHQELMLTDILHAFAQNPTNPSYDPDWQAPRTTRAKDGFVTLADGVHTIGHPDGAFCFDNERPAHEVLLRPVSLAHRLVTNADWLAFMADGGYRTPALWLSDGWAKAERDGWSAPGYWREIDGRWFALTLGGLRPVDGAAPVCHVSYYEADAFARWAGKHLPSESEWEVAARTGEIDHAFGVVWQWTRSAYAPYPGFVATRDALGEYNGKFMVNQMVLRGSSFATAEGHARTSYRNFFYPPARWQFTGLRLAEYPD